MGVALERAPTRGHLVQDDRRAKTRPTADRQAFLPPARVTCTRPCRRCVLRWSRTAVGIPASAQVATSSFTFARPKSSTLRRPSRVEHGVGRLQIAMRDAALVRGAHRIGKRDGEVSTRSSGSPSGGMILLERLAVDELEREKRHAVGFLDRMDGDDVRMIERGGGARLALEALAPIGITARAAGKHLECDVPSSLVSSAR